MSARGRDGPDEGGTTPGDEHGLDRLVDAADRTAEHDVLEHVPPSFASVVARAHRIDPAAVSADDVELASGVHRKVARAFLDEVPEADEIDELAAFVTAAREEAELDIEAWEHEGLPAMRRPAPRRIGTMTLAGALALAAGLVLAIGWLESWRAAVQHREHDGDQALAGVDTMSEVHEASSVVEVAPDKPVPRRKPRAREDGPAPESEAAFVVPEEPVPLEPAPVVVAPQAIPGPAAAVRPQPRKRAGGALQRLEARAQSAVADGDLELADRLYGQLIERGGKAALVELAYADRFTIARRRGDAAARRQLWNEYLRKFPRGRFADDARAGLCRVAAAADKPKCWKGYVADFPAGAYRSHAERWLPGAGGGSESTP